MKFAGGQWVHPADALTQRKVFQRRRLTNLSALWEIGFSANRRLLGVPRLSHNPARAEQAFTAVRHPIVTSDGQRIAGLRLGDSRPCIECFSTDVPVSVPDLVDAAGRWPAFVAAVAQRGAYRSVHALPLRSRGDAIGTMNLFHRHPGALPEADLALGQALADVATIGILSERAIRRGEVVTEQLQTALSSRVIIEQAKGVLAQQGGLSMAAAVDRLRGYARTRNTRPPRCSVHPPYRAREPTSGSAAFVTPSNQ